VAVEVDWFRQSETQAATTAAAAAYGACRSDQERYIVGRQLGGRGLEARKLVGAGIG